MIEEGNVKGISDILKIYKSEIETLEFYFYLVSNDINLSIYDELKKNNFNFMNISRNFKHLNRMKYVVDLAIINGNSKYIKEIGEKIVYIVDLKQWIGMNLSKETKKCISVIINFIKTPETIYEIIAFCIIKEDLFILKKILDRGDYLNGFKNYFKIDIVFFAYLSKKVNVLNFFKQKRFSFPFKDIIIYKTTIDKKICYDSLKRVYFNVNNQNIDIFYQLHCAHKFSKESYLFFQNLPLDVFNIILDYSGFKNVQDSWIKTKLKAQENLKGDSRQAPILKNFEGFTKKIKIECPY